MKLYRSIKRVFISLLFIGVLVSALHAALVYSGITFTSEKGRIVLIEQLKKFTQRNVVIDGDVKITISLMPELLVERIHIKNSEGFDKEDFITVSEVHVRVSLLLLLTGNLDLDKLVADRANIYLIQKKDGSNNWSFDHLLKEQEPDGEKHADITDKQKENLRLSIGLIRLTDINVNYIDESNNQSFEEYFSKLIIDLRDKESLKGEVVGIVQAYPYDMTFNAIPDNEFTSGYQWKLKGAGSITGRDINIDAIIQLHELTVGAFINVVIQDIDVGAILDRLGIVSDEEVISEQLQLKIQIQGKDVTEIYQTAEVDLLLTHGYWQRPSILTGQPTKLTFDKALIRTYWSKPIELHLDGKLSDVKLRFDLKTNRLEEFFDEVEKLDIDLKAHIAGSDLALKGTLDLPIKTRQFQLDISLKGKDLEKLNTIFSSELPPFNNYSFTGKISSNERGFIVRADDATIGNTHFETAIVIDTSSIKPFWTININSRQLQIKDFEFATSKIEKPDAAAIKTSLEQIGGESREEPGRHLKHIVDDPKMHFDLTLKVDNVMAGESALGPSSLSLKLRENTLIMDDVELSVPGGKIKSSAAFTVENKQVKGALKLDIDKFEYGAVSRYFRSSSDEGGVISARVDLKLGGRDFSRLFDQATGKLDVALWPRNSKSKIFDLWATNLFLVILPEIRKDESRINCLVALMDLDDGIMKEDFFGIDTTKVWMHGNINVNFVEELVRLSLYPRSKKARLFAVQAPIRVEGNFSNTRLMTNPVDITVAYLSFITSPLHVPARRIFDDKVPEDASEICEHFYDREYVRALKINLKKEEQKEIDEWLDSD